MSKESKEEADPIIKKIARIYENYGIDVSNMSEEEFERIKDLYQITGRDLDQDLAESEGHRRYSKLFDDKLI